MFCHKCGNQVEDGSNFCPKCGTSVVAKETVGADSSEKLIPRNSWAVWTTRVCVSGIFSLLFTIYFICKNQDYPLFFFCLLSVIAAVAAVVTGVIGLRYAKKYPESKGAISSCKDLKPRTSRKWGVLPCYFGLASLISSLISTIFGFLYIWYCSRHFDFFRPTPTPPWVDAAAMVSFLFFLLGVPLGISAVISGFIGLSYEGQSPNDNARTGLIMGAFTIIFGISVIIMFMLH